jgi:hypothetical protein
MAVVRWSMLAVGVGLTTLSFVRLVEERVRAAGATPWWWLGLIGVGVTALALGSPLSARSRRGDGRGRTGS